MSQTHFHSFASSAKGTSEPDTIEVFDVEADGSCDVRGCIRSEKHEHTTISWHGGEYSRTNTWISADSADVVDLDDNY